MAAMTAPCTNATLGNVRFSAGYEGEADINQRRKLVSACPVRPGGAQQKPNPGSLVTRASARAPICLDLNGAA
jgi:hypothetical protein